ncbi:MAG: redoxin domain-containing protein [Deltaproteobacteria bacterium]|nr:redoxin domain-containing protein [Deltaproteobacteria bacterium]
MRVPIAALAALAAVLLALPSGAEVLGPCGTPDAQKPSAAAQAAPAPASAGPAAYTARVPLPGEQAPNFSVDAVVGDKVKTIKLSDYDGKWRVICFYPADFTFV